MSEKHIAKTQLGAHAAITGFEYQRDFIALLTARMICKSENISKIICEYKNDIEILIGNELTSWQIKSTTANSVSTREVYDSIKLFSLLNNIGEYSRFVLVSNRNFTRKDMGKLALYDLDDFSELKSKIQRKFKRNLDESFLAKIKFTKGPEPDSIHSIISDELSCLKPKTVKSLDLISFVDRIWIGLKDITQFEIQDIKERKNRNIEFKTITYERVKEEVLDKDVDISPPTDLEFEPEGIDESRDEEKIIDPDEEETRYLIKKYKHDVQFRANVLKKFEELSKTIKLYKSILFMKFLLKISRSEDKHEVLSFLFMLHNLILLSNKYDKQIHSCLVAKYKPVLGIGFSEFRGKFSHSQTKNVLNSLDLVDEEWCELHWKRIKNAIVAGITPGEIQEIYDNIVFLRKCKSLPRYRKYLAKRDKYIEIKREIEKLLIAG